MNEIDTFRCLRRLFSIARSMAKKRKIEFKLDRDTYSEFVQQPCGYCGAPGSNTLNYSGLVFHWTGLDRIDNSRGYEKDNVVPACRFCNSLRGNMPFPMWAGFVNDIVKKHGGEPPFDVEECEERARTAYWKR